MSMKKYEEEFWKETVGRKNCERFGSKINQLKEDKILTNVKIVCRDSQVFDCHTVILAAVGDYFARIFEDRDHRDPFFQAVGVDGAEFNYVMQFAYEGEVQIDDENVLTLLRVSHTFEMTALEDWCVRYLTERDIPTTRAVELFAFACTAQKTALIRPIARFILNNLREVTKGGAGLPQLDLEQMRTLLDYWQSSTRKRERELLIVLAHWISHLRQDQHPGKEALLTEFFNKLQFEHFEKASAKQTLQTTGNINLDVEIPHIPSESLSLCLYLRDSIFGECSLLRYSRTSEEKITVRSTPLTEVYMEMKTAAVNDKLYLYSVDAKGPNGPFSFSRYSSATLLDKMPLLTLEEAFPHASGRPFSRSDFESLHMCSDPIRECIYVSRAFNETSSSGKLFSYLCESNRWLPICHHRDPDFYSGMVVRSCSDGRLYMTRFAQEQLHVYAYDCRVGECTELASPLEATIEQNNRFCFHKEKLYFAHDQIAENGSRRRRVGLVVYDPVAARWNKITPNPTNVPINGDVRVVSFDNRLWMFGRNLKSISDCNYYYQTFDSFTQKWDAGSIWREGQRWTVLDMTVFKS